MGVVPTQCQDTKPVDDVRTRELRWVTVNNYAHRKDELERGYFMDMKELRIDPTGKFFKASEQLLYPIRSTPFPITKKLKSMGGGKVDVVKEAANQSPTLVLVTSNRLMAHEMINSWRNPFAQEFPNLTVYEVNLISLAPAVCLYITSKNQIELVQKVGLWFLGPWIRYQQRKLIEEERWKSLLYYNSIRWVKKWRFTLEMKNMLVGYAFLLDQDGLIRWRAVGKALPEEIESMLKHTRTLLKVKRPNTKTTVLVPTFLLPALELTDSCLRRKLA